jgi:phosphoglycerate dehydrogenase-like enzyme
MAAANRPVVILQPAPQRSSRIFSPASLDALRADFGLVDLEGEERAAAFDEALPQAFAVIGQPDLDQARLDRAGRLRAICNVEGNFFPNVDYETCFARGIYVLGCGPAYARAVAEHALGLALDLARGISREDRAFRAGREHYVADGNEDSILLSRSSVGLIGYGNLGQALHRLLQPFAPEIRVFDPWLPDSVLREQGLRPASLETTLSESRFVFVLATVTAESEHLLGPAELDLLQPDARLIVVSRAAVVDFDAMISRLGAGRFRAAVDVWPTEPVPPDHPARSLEGLVFSGHRAGGIPEAFLQIGEMVVDDLRQIARGLPPVRMQVAARELVGRYRNRPVT